MSTIHHHHTSLLAVAATHVLSFVINLLHREAVQPMHVLGPQIPRVVPPFDARDKIPAR